MASILALRIGAAFADIAGAMPLRKTRRRFTPCSRYIGGVKPRRCTASRFSGERYWLHHTNGAEARVSLRPHVHDEYLVCAQLRGIETCRVAGREHRFSPGDLVFINPLQVHTGNGSAEALEYLSLYVDRQWLTDLIRDVVPARQSPEFVIVRAHEHTPAFVRMSELWQRVQCEASRAHEDPANFDALVAQLVVHAFAEFSNLRRPRVRSTNRVPLRHIARTLEALHALSESVAPIDLDDLAAIAGLSKFHYLREFDRCVGLTPLAYLRAMRLSRAARDLRTTTASVRDVAVRAGFAEQSSFCRAFVRQTGVSPTAYRNRTRC